MGKFKVCRLAGRTSRVVSGFYREFYPEYVFPHDSQLQLLRLQLVKRLFQILGIALNRPRLGVWQKYPWCRTTQLYHLALTKETQIVLTKPRRQSEISWKSSLSLSSIMAGYQCRVKQKFTWLCRRPPKRRTAEKRVKTCPKNA